MTQVKLSPEKSSPIYNRVSDKSSLTPTKFFLSVQEVLKEGVRGQGQKEKLTVDLGSHFVCVNSLVLALTSLSSPVSPQRVTVGSQKRSE